MEKYRYRAFSLCLESDIPFPELISDNSENIDVQISFCSKSIQADIDFYIPNVAHFYVHAGKHIWVKPDKGATFDQIRLFLLGSSMGAILHQRRQLVLHGNAIEIDGKCSVFLGPSGNGKSTLAGAFLKQGYRVLTDDICAITFQNNMPTVSPGYPQIKLWRDSAENLGHEPSKLTSIYDRSDKFALPIHNSFANKPLAVDQIFVLNTWERAQIELRRLSGINRFQAIFDNTYRQNFMKRTGQDQNYFKLCSQLISTTPLFSLTRPQSPYCLDELMLMFGA